MDGVDITKVGLTDLRSRLTIIPRKFYNIDEFSSLIPASEDPTILSGTLRSTLDVFDEYDDADIVKRLCFSSPAPRE